MSSGISHIDDIGRTTPSNGLARIPPIAALPSPTVRRMPESLRTASFGGSPPYANCAVRTSPHATALWIVGLAGEAETSLYDTDLKGPLALVMGSEGEGMRRLTREHCDRLASLPMKGSVESLNVSVATGIALFEAVRQRGR